MVVRKAEKNKDKGHRELSQEIDVDGESVLEPYKCTGKFAQDFIELCRRQGISPAPLIRNRLKAPGSPGEKQSSEIKQEKGSRKMKEKDKEKEHSTHEFDGDEHGDNAQVPQEPPPKTFVTRDRFEYFVPNIQVEVEHHEKEKVESVSEIYIRGWKVDNKMMNVLEQCLPALERLQLLHFWNVGLSVENLQRLATTTLPKCRQLKKLVLDGCLNVDRSSVLGGETLPEVLYHLIGPDSLLQHLSLRFNKLDDETIRIFSHTLGSFKRSNNKLIFLDLTGNLITDLGAQYIANALRMNRTLLVLSLASNKIGDDGAKCLAESISRFKLSHEEIVERRMQFSKKESSSIERSGSQKSPPASRKSDRRPGSNLSHTDRAGGTKKQAKKKDGANKKDDDGHGGKKKNKDLDGGTKAGKKDKGGGGGKQSGSGGAEKDNIKEKTKGSKDKTKGRDSKRSTVAAEANTPEVTEAATNPLLDPAEPEDGELWIKGNVVLISLNLMNNLIGEVGTQHLLKAVQYQLMFAQFKTLSSGKAPGSHANIGLLKLNLSRNAITPPTHCETLMKLTDLMTKRDPFYKPEKLAGTGAGGSRASSGTRGATPTAIR